MKFIDKVKTFIQTGELPIKKSQDGKTHWAVHPFQIGLYTVKSIGKHEIALRSAALTIYTVMSLVPIAALVFGILKGFGFEKNLTDYLYESLPQYTNVIDTLMVFVNRMLEKTRGGIIAAVGVVVLMWSVIKVFGNIEDAFNHIWEVKKARSMARKFTDYIAVIFIAPILLVASISLGTFIRNFLSFLSWSWLVDILLWLASLVLVWVLFAFVFYVMPNTKVKIKGAIIAAIISGTAFYIFTFIYFYIQGSVSSYNAIYGTFAAIPLFLAWMQTSWQILLIGGELSFAYQNIDRYEQERMAASMDGTHRKKALLATMLSIVEHYLDEEGGPVSADSIANELNLPVRIIREMIFDLEKAGLIVAVQTKDDNKTYLYIPSKDVHTIKVSEVLESIESNFPEPDFNQMPEMHKVSELLDEMKARAYAPELDVSLPEIIDKKQTINS